MVSKVNTAAQIVFVVAVLGVAALARPLDVIVNYGSIPVALLTVASGAAYLRAWLEHMDDSTGGSGRRNHDTAAAIPDLGRFRCWCWCVFLWVFSSILLPFIAGLVLAYFLDPVADALERLGLPRLAAALVIVVASILLLVLALVILAPMLADQIGTVRHRPAAC